MSRMREPITGYALAVVLAVCISLCVATLIVTLAVNRNTERKFCEVVGAARVTEQGKLRAYNDQGPTTAAGIAQKSELEKSVARSVRLERNLGCPQD